MDDATRTVCELCGRDENFYCRDSETGQLRPLCVEYAHCGEHANGSAMGDGRCRDCSIQHQLDGMQCSGCQRMRYRERDGTRVADMMVGVAEALWGERCVCDPQPPSLAEARATTT